MPDLQFFHQQRHCHIRLIIRNLASRSTAKSFVMKILRKLGIPTLPYVKLRDPL
jgi:hypothetical protein